MWLAMFVHPAAWAALGIVGHVLQLVVFARLVQRFQARVAHIELLRRQSAEDGAAAA
jgi:hypothetical protein